MKKINLFLATIVAATTFSLTSCTDECKDVVCNNGGLCVEGTCDCADGYEGDNCDTEMRAKFIATYDMTITSTCDSSGTGNFTYSMQVSNSSAAVTKILIDLGSTIVADVNADGTTFTIASQTIDGYTYTGNGSIAGSTLTVTINEYDPSYPETCVYTGSGSKQ